MRIPNSYTGGGAARSNTANAIKEHNSCISLVGFASPLSMLSSIAFGTVKLKPGERHHVALVGPTTHNLPTSKWEAIIGNAIIGNAIIGNAILRNLNNPSVDPKHFVSFVC